MTDRAYAYAMTGLLVGCLVFGLVLLFVGAVIASPWLLVLVPIDVALIVLACWIAYICCDRSLDA